VPPILQGFGVDPLPGASLNKAAAFTEEGMAERKTKSTTRFALKEFTAAEEARIGALVRKAVG